MGYREVCVIPRCPYRTVVRIAVNDNSKRQDFCFHHGVTALILNEGNVKILFTWGGQNTDNFDKAVAAYKKARNL